MTTWWWPRSRGDKMMPNFHECDEIFLRATCFNCGCTFPVKRDEVKAISQRVFLPGLLLPACPECFSLLAAHPSTLAGRSGFYAFTDPGENGGLCLCEPEAV